MSNIQQKVGRVRAASLTAVSKAIDLDLQPGVWAGVGSTIAHAPNISELRSATDGGEKIKFDAHGHNIRNVSDVPQLQHKHKHHRHQHHNTHNTHKTAPIPEGTGAGETDVSRLVSEKSAGATHLTSLNSSDKVVTTSTSLDTAPVVRIKHSWPTTIKHGLTAFWKFFLTPTGFLLTLYSANVVAWGAMLFFLELHAAPAMDHPDNGNADSSPRKIWLEIDSQVLNALFCLTAWGLAPWRFRDARWLLTWRTGWAGPVHGERAFRRLCKRNANWFRPREEAHDASLITQPISHVNSDANGTTSPNQVHSHDSSLQQHRSFGQVLHDFAAPPLEAPSAIPRITFTGNYAPPTSPQWKLDVVVWLYVLNSLFQVGMAFFMWHWNRIDRPGWGAGTFIGLGCASAMMAGVVTWWDGRKVKKVEGPMIRIDGHEEPIIEEKTTGAIV